MVRQSSGLQRVYESSQVMESRFRYIVKASRNVGVILRLRPKGYREEEVMVGFISFSTEDTYSSKVRSIGLHSIQSIKLAPNGKPKNEVESRN